MADAARLVLALLPLIAIAAAAITLRPRDPDTIAPIRLAIVRGGVAIGALAVAGVELLSTMDTVTVTGALVFWLVVTALALAGAVVRWPKSLPRKKLGRSWALAGLAGLVLAELVLAVASAPN